MVARARSVAKSRGKGATNTRGSGQRSAVPMPNASSLKQPLGVGDGSHRHGDLGVNVQCLLRELKARELSNTRAQAVRLGGLCDGDGMQSAVFQPRGLRLLRIRVSLASKVVQLLLESLDL